MSYPKHLESFFNQATLLCNLALVPVASGCFLANLQPTQAQGTQAIQVRAGQGVTLANATGEVLLRSGSSVRRAQRGQRIDKIGDSFTTARGVTATLNIDTNMGTIEMMDNTKVQVQSYRTAPDGGRLLRLAVSQGRVRLQVRKFTHSTSRLEIQTPAMIGGVRGTAFLVAVQPTGKTAIATEEGAVYATSQNISYDITRGYQTYAEVGQAPVKPFPIQSSVDLNYRVERTLEGNQRVIRLIGKVEPLNSVLVNGVTQAIDPQGYFTVSLPPAGTINLQIKVSNLLGNEKSYVINPLEDFSVQSR
ncbi:MAG: FecR family protein [Pseudanabaena sp. ELA607]